MGRNRQVSEADPPLQVGRITPAHRYHGGVRRLITRLDDELFVKLKKRAAAEGRSVNALVNDILTSQVAGRTPRAELRLRAGEQILRYADTRDDRQAAAAAAMGLETA